MLTASSSSSSSSSRSGGSVDGAAGPARPAPRSAGRAPRDWISQRILRVSSWTGVSMASTSKPVRRAGPGEPRLEWPGGGTAGDRAFDPASVAGGRRRGGHGRLTGGPGGGPGGGRGGARTRKGRGAGWGKREDLVGGRVLKKK